MATKKKASDLVNEEAEIKVVRKRAAPRAEKIEVAAPVEEQPSLLDSFVFMEKTLSCLDIGLKTGKNVVLYGPGGHGKSELTMEFFNAMDISPYVITMGAGMTTDRLFGGIDIKSLDADGKLEYLVLNSFMNHEFVIFEEMMDSPDFIMEQLKDVLSSGKFRNGTQEFDIKTRFIVGTTNKTRAEFAKNDSLKALMERFPLEHNVVWPQYTSIAYNTLLEKRFGQGRVDPTIPFILQEYHKSGITISPRIALDAYDVYETCGPDSLGFIADFAKKPEIIANSLKKFKESLKFREASGELDEAIKEAKERKMVRPYSKAIHMAYIQAYRVFDKKFTELKKIQVEDEMASQKAVMVKHCEEFVVTNAPYLERARKAVKEDASANTEA